MQFVVLSLAVWILGEMDAQFIIQAFYFFKNIYSKQLVFRLYIAGIEFPVSG